MCEHVQEIMSKWWCLKLTLFHSPSLADPHPMSLSSIYPYPSSTTTVTPSSPANSLYGIQILIPTLTLLDKTQFLDQPGGASNVYRSLLPFLSYNFLLIIFLEIAFSKIWGLVAEESAKRGGERKWIQVLTGTLHLCPFPFFSLFSFLLFTLYFGLYLSSLFLYSL